MKLLAFFALALILTSCQKDTVNSIPTSHRYLSTIQYSLNRSLVVDSFTYDSDMRLTKFAEHKWDSSGTSVIQGRLETSFQYNGTDSIPASYIFTGLREVENHLLSFDSQNRITKDTSLNGTHNVVYFSYSNVGMSSIFLFGGNFLERQLDSLFLSSGNMTNRRVYYSNGSPTADLSGSIQVEYTSLANPAYQTKITSTIGPLLHILSYDGYGGLQDFISKNLPRKIIFTNDVGVSNEGNCTWNTDSHGNVISGTSIGGLQFNIQFNYY